MSLTELDDRTAFERFALESAASVQETDRRVRGRYDKRTGKGATLVYAQGILIGGSEKLQESLRPLMFGAAWKILDQIVEYSVGATGSKHVPIADKVAAARALTTPPSPLDANPAIWAAIVSTYAETKELRNGLVHRRAEVTGDRMLRTKDPKSGAALEISAEQQLAFCRLSQRLIDAILLGAIDDRKLFDLSFQLRELSTFSGTTQTIGRNHRQIYELSEQIEVTDGVARIDVSSLRALAAEKFGEAEYIDYTGWITDAEVLCGPLDEADSEEYRFAVSDLPSWLHKEYRLTE